MQSGGFLQANAGYKWHLEVPSCPSPDPQMGALLWRLTAWSCFPCSCLWYKETRKCVGFRVRLPLKAMSWSLPMFSEWPGRGSSEAP